MSIVIENFSLIFEGEAKPLFQDLSLNIEGWTCILGQSGCGKTTLLRMLAGLISSQHTVKGNAYLQDEDMRIPLTNQHIAYMGQQDLLFPWLSVIENVCLPIVIKGKKPSKRQLDSAQQLLSDVGLSDIANKRPDQLSGGMRQRVALARTLMQDKPVVLMDEPFSALDAVTRHKLQNLSAELLAEKDVLLITHDPQEALRLGHQLFWMQSQPAQLALLETPNTSPPRRIDPTLALHHQQIIEQLGGGYDC